MKPEIVFFILFALPSGLLSASSCNCRLLNIFYLTGMDISIPEPMHVCTFVKDKCCTVADEVRLSHFWNLHSEPLLDARASLIMMYVRKSVEAFWEIMRLDPLDIILKYVVRRRVPYQNQICQTQTRVISRQEYLRFDRQSDDLNRHIFQAVHNLTRPANETFNITSFTHDEFRERHWGIRYNKLYNDSMHHRPNETQIPDFPTPEATMETAVCANRRARYTKEFVIVNRHKTNFCLRLYERFLNFDAEKFNGLLPIIKSSLSGVMDLKKTLYCYACDAHSQSRFDLSGRRIVLGYDFCKNLVSEYRDLINFMHVIYIEYIDSLLQYVACFETNARPLPLPYPNFLTKYRRRIGIIQRCLANIDTPNFINNCWFICNKFSLHGISNFWDGELELFTRFYTTIGSFFRKIRIEREEDERFEKFKTDNRRRPILTTTGNVDGLLIEPLSEAINAGNLITNRRYYMNPEDMMLLLNTTNTTSGNIPIQARIILEQFLGLIGIRSINEALNLRNTTQNLIETLQRMNSTVNDTNDQVLINGLVNRLNSVLNTTNVTADLYPRRLSHKDTLSVSRSLRSMRPIPYNLSQFLVSRFDMKKPKTVRPLTRVRESKVVEPLSQIFEKMQADFDISTFESQVEPAGLNPIWARIHTDFNYNVTNILDNTFKNAEDLSNNVIEQFFINDNKDINEFNFDIDTDIEPVDLLPDMKKVGILARYAREHNNTALLKKVETLKKIIESDHSHTLNAKKQKLAQKRIEKEYLKFKAEVTELRLKEAGNKTDHTHKASFPSNFNGITEFFTSLFGS